MSPGTDTFSNPSAGSEDQTSRMRVSMRWPNSSPPGKRAGSMARNSAPLATRSFPCTGDSVCSVRPKLLLASTPAMTSTKNAMP